MWTATNLATGDWLLFTDADVIFKPDSLRRALAYAEAETADHVVLFPRMIMKTSGRAHDDRFFPDACSCSGIGPGRWLIPRPAITWAWALSTWCGDGRTKAVGTYEALRMEVLDDMKLGKVVKNAGFAQRNVFGGDLISIRWAQGAIGVVNNLTKNFFAVLSFQWLAHGAVGVRLGVPESRSVSRDLAGAGMGAAAVSRLRWLRSS